MIAALLWAVPAMCAGNPEAALRLADDLYARGAFSDALKKYQEVAGAGLESGELYYNMGNAHFRLGRKGMAILCYRRAQRLIPRDREVRENLEFVRSLSRDKTNPMAQLQDTWLTELPDKVSSPELIHFIAVVFSISIAFFCGAVYFDSRKAVNFARRGGMAFLVLWLAASCFLVYKEYRARKAPGAVVLAPRREALAGPGDSYSPLFILHEGAETTIEKTEGDWLKISYPSVGSGWIHKKDLGKI